MVQRSHLEDTFFIPQLVAADLQHYTYGLEDEDATDKRQKQLLLDDYRHSGDGSAQCQRTYISHEDLCWMRVVPEEADTRADHCAAEDRQLADQWHTLQLKIVGKDDMSAHIRQY